MRTSRCLLSLVQRLFVLWLLVQCRSYCWFISWWVFFRLWNLFVFNHWLFLNSVLARLRVGLTEGGLWQLPASPCTTFSGGRAALLAVPSFICKFCSPFFRLNINNCFISQESTILAALRQMPNGWVASVPNGCFLGFGIEWNSGSGRAGNSWNFSLACISRLFPGISFGMYVLDITK